LAVASASAVSVLVMDCTTTGADEPTGTPRTFTVTVGRREPNPAVEDDTIRTLRKEVDRTDEPESNPES